ncbi:Gp138 family membrane-puncturing spike protein [Acetobacter tropicalis]|uniref:Baseplate assembly protein n=2 Tax=Acetobacter TaxID=434 RepID=A0A291PJC7_9PROT|nr:Gp138 family membrane-puncturing spike protein [Acetobacter tropicalis]ATJ91526.1 baseplate assembly protein [Acetobacter tropicalis]
MIGANTLVRVKAVHAAGLNPVGTVDVQIMVHQQDGIGRTTPHGTLCGLPYLRIQGGKRAFICDPSVGDIGAAIICGRDISNVKSTRSEAAPGSYRQHDYSDGLYLGGYLNAAPEEYCGWVGSDFHVKTAGKFVVDASECDINCKVNVTGPVAASGDVTAGSISLENHVHGGVQGGSSTTSTPE